MSDGKKTKICEGCGQPFEVNWPKQRYCCRTCYTKHRYDQELQGVCEECGKPFRKNSMKQRFCGLQCAGRYTAKHKKKPGESPTIRDCVCQHCGKPFQAKRERKFCSDECRKEHQRKSDPERYGTAVCPVCKKEFVKKKENQVFCSKECRVAYQHVEYAASMERKHTKIKIRVLKEIPVYAHLRPKVGSIWEATEFLLLGSVKECYIETHGKQVILRKGEYERLA